MLCPNCGRENPTAFGYCVGCQKPLSTVGGAAAMPAMAPVSQPRQMSRVAGIFLAVVTLLALLVGILKPVDPGDPAFMAGEHLGALIVVLGLPALIAWLVAGRRKVRHPKRFALIFCLVSGFLTLANALAFLNLEPPEARFGRLMREAAGVQPVRQKGFPNERRFDDQVREQYRKLLQQNRDYVAAVGRMDVSKVKDLNAAPSFASPEAAQQGLEQLHSLYAADAEQEEKVVVIMNDLRRILESSAGSESERQAMLRGFDTTAAAEFSKRKETLVAERAWVDAVDDAHAYATAHREGMMLVNGQLVIPQAAVRNEFNVKIDLLEERRKAFLQAQKQLSQSQSDSLNRMGLSRKDLSGK
jgi:energy-converting hydrogenase Eha subunit F